MNERGVVATVVFGLVIGFAVFSFFVGRATAFRADHNAVAVVK